MQQDPYSVLGLMDSASMDEVTAAYRKLAKKYHPDLNPGDAAADAKMRQINAAYEQIKSGKTGGAKYERPDGSYGPRPESGQGQRTYQGSDPFGGFQYGNYADFEDIFSTLFGGAGQGQYAGQNRGSTSPERQVRQYLQRGQCQAAEQLLTQMPHNAEWYFLSAITNAGLGNRIMALTQAKEAVRMDPNNPEYRSLLDQFEKGSFTYRQAGQQQGYNMQNFGNTLFKLMLAQCFCMCCCRGC